MRLLFVGDIVGTPGVAFLKKALPVLVAREGIDCVVANAENAVAGSGLTPSVYRKVREAGADLVTLGDHIYKKAEIIPTLNADDRVCKPANFPPDAPGREVRVIANASQTSDSEAVKVCHDIARAIEEQLHYPGEIKVTVVRETRAVEYAK